MGIITIHGVQKNRLISRNIPSRRFIAPRIVRSFRIQKLGAMFVLAEGR